MELFGRAGERARLLSVVRVVVESGRRRGAIVLGPPGIGKTSLLHAALDDAGTHGFVTVHVRVPSDTALSPMFPIGEIVRRVGASDDAALPIAELPPIETARAIDTAARGRPLLIAIDDFQWLSPDAASRLVCIVRTLESPTAFIATVRSHSVEHGIPLALAELSGDLWLERVSLDGLEEDAVQVLAEAILEGPVLDSLRDALCTRTGGNPLFVAECIRAWRRDGVLTSVAGFWQIRSVAATALTGELEHVIADRLRLLPSDILRVAGAIALFGRAARLSDIAAFVESTGDDVARAVNVLVAEGIIRATDDAASFD
ncbi:MAG TPA: AAA family ATPase, partial [Actinomycetota bacterium]|nr:AAA family ATPase [Actinomycetota bacterium]